MTHDHHNHIDDDDDGERVEHVVGDSDHGFLLVDVDSDDLWSFVVPPLPDINTAWRGLADICQSTITSVYNSVQTMLVHDAEHVTQVLLDLEQLHITADSPPSTVQAEHAEARPVTRSMSPPPEPAHQHQPGPSPASTDISPRSARKRRRTPKARHAYGHNTGYGPPHRPLRASSPHPLLIPNTHPSAPSILITPSAPQSRTFACASAPPVQDSCCGSRLTLPRMVLHPQRASSSAVMMDSERGRRRRGGVLLGRTVLGVGVGSGKKGRL